MDIVKRVLSLVEPDVLAWLLKHVRLEANPEIPTAAATLGKDGYRIILGRMAESWTDRQLLAALEHEIAHVIRGDLLAPQLKQNPPLWNIAADAVINESLKGLPRGCVKWDKLAEAVPDLPRTREGAVAIYHALEKAAEVVVVSWDNLEGPSNEDRKKAEERHAAAVLDAPDSLRGGRDVEPTMRPTGVRLKPPPLLGVINKLVRLAGRGTQRVRTRTYMREGLEEGLKGILRSPRARVVLALDCSGSMSRWVGAYQAMCLALKKRGIEVERWVWADGAERWPDGHEMPNVGGGTCLSALWDALPVRGNDLVVVLTDGELADENEARPKSPERLVWVLAPRGHEPWPALATLQLEEE